MNGGRLSDEEAMAQGLVRLRQSLAEAEATAEPPRQALRMVAMRFPEEAEELEMLWLGAAQPAARERLETLLADLERQHAADCAED